MLLKNGLVFIEGKFVETNILIKGNKIAGIGSDLTDEKIIDCKNCYVLPGLVEIHSHGCVGEDFSTSGENGIDKMCRYYAANGITSVLATTMTDSKEQSFKAMSTIANYCNQEHEASKILGIHMEGPFLGKDKKGAHDEQYLTGIEKDFFEKLDELSEKRIRLVSIDPNLSGAMEFIQKYKAEKVISLAHTSASYDTAIEALKKGASHVTHLFNAMNPLHHREPGLVGAALEYPCFSEVICDGIHIHPAIIRFLFQSIPDKLVLISDSMMAAGLNDGNYQLGGLNVAVQEGRATLEDGTIAGSATNLYRSMCNAIQFGVRPEAAILSATYLPAKSIGRDDLAGSIQIGRVADILVLRQDYTIQSIFVEGKQFHND